VFQHSRSLSPEVRVLFCREKREVRAPAIRFVAIKYNEAQDENGGWRNRERKRQACGHVETRVCLEHDIQWRATWNSLWCPPRGFAHLHRRWQSDRADQLRRPQALSFGGGTLEEQAEAFKTFLSYAGWYTLNGDKVTHHIEISSIQNYVGKDLVRSVKFHGDQIVLVTPPTPVNGKIQSVELTWQRVPAVS